MSNRPPTRGRTEIVSGKKLPDAVEHGIPDAAVHPAVALQRTTASSSALGSPEVIALQRSAGNQAVQGLLARRLNPAPAADAGPTVEEPARDKDGVAADAGGAVARAASSSGRPLPEELRDRFERSLDTDLSEVRVHTSAVSAEAAAAVAAQAYTVGEDIHFAAGYYAPDTSRGANLLAHEVAHTVQQRGGTTVRQDKPAVSRPHDSAERQADHAAAAMVRGQPASVSVAAPTIQRRGNEDIPPPPGMQTLKNLGPVSIAVRNGETDGGQIPSPKGLFDLAARNYTAFAQHCTNVQSTYTAQAGGVSIPIIGELGKNSTLAGFAKTAGDANAYCERGNVTAMAAATAVEGWVPLLQQSQDKWKQARDAATKAKIDVVNKDGSAGLDKEGVEAEGQQLQGSVRLVSNKEVPDTPADATPQQKADLARRRASSDQDTLEGKNIKKESKVLLDEATTNFEQTQKEMTSARSRVISTHGKAVKSLLSAKLKANAERKKTAEDKKAGIEEILGMVDKVEASINKGRGLVNDVDGFNLLEDTGKEAKSIKASQIARMVLQLDGTIGEIEGDIAACKTREENLKSIIEDAEMKANAREYARALRDFKEALSIMPERIKRYEEAHRAFAESVNMALMKRGVIKPGEDGVKPIMELLAQLRVAKAATAAALGATSDVRDQVVAVSSLGDPPQPDVCQIGGMVATHARMFGTAPSHIQAIEGVLKKREAAIEQSVSAMAI